MKIIKPIIFLFILVLTTTYSYATHIVGGNMNYKYLGNDKYELTLTMFRDCWNGVPPFDSPASIGIFDVNNVLLFDIKTIPRSIVNIPPSLDDSCYKPPVNVCYERAIYVDTVTLPLIIGGYQIVYQRCCRNGTIVNLVAPGETGATYMATIPTDTLITNINNSNPVFNAWPQLFLCANKPLVFDHSATDYDGDSLAYELFLPLQGADQAIPMPQPPNNPPYANILWETPYTTNNMMGGVPMAINSQTGLLTATPNLLGQFVVGIKCKEYRNGVLISETLRDFQFNVVLCQKFTTAASIVPILYCTNSTPVTVGFANNSTGANAYMWNFGTAQTNDTSHLTTPTYTYADTGYYNVQLIAYGIKKGCNDTVNKQLHIATKPQAIATVTRVSCQDTVLLSAQATNAVYPVGYLWTLGDGTLSTDSVVQHAYTSATNYTAQVITITANGCKDTLTQQITIPSQTPLVTTDVEMCKYNSTALSIANCTSPVWSPNMAIDNVNSFTPVVNPLQNTTYYISANTTSSNGEVCPQHDSVLVTVNDIPNATINFDKGNCSSTISIVNGSTTPNANITTATVNWGDGTTNNGTYSHTYTQVGAYTITLYIMDNKGCKDTTTQLVKNFNLPKGKKQITVLCKTQSILLTAQYAQGYNWYPNKKIDSLQIQKPTIYADSSIAYYCTLTNYPTSTDTCATQDTVIIKVSQTNALAQLNLTALYDTIVIGESSQLSFSANTLGAQSILLNDNSTHALPSSLEVKPTVNTTYYATIKDSLGCVFNYGDSVRVVVLSNICAEPYVLIPTGFTPNNDGVNDEFIVSGITVGLSTNTTNYNVEDYVVVYNRWGQKVFETYNIKQGWDGKYNGLLQDAGAYAYIVKLTCAGGMKLEQKGNVTLIR